MFDSICTYVCMQASVYVCICVYMYICVYENLYYVCNYICMYGCMFACIYIYAYACTHADKYRDAIVSLHMFTSITVSAKLSLVLPVDYREGTANVRKSAKKNKDKHQK